VSGIMGGGFEIVSFPFRKPLIQKTEKNVGTGRGCAEACARSGWMYIYSLDWSAGAFRVKQIFYRLWWEDEAQDIAEYAVMLAVILLIVVGTIQLIGSSANNVFSSVASSIQ
jgi:Flp pilus assembly pilin Flp